MGLRTLPKDLTQRGQTPRQYLGTQNSYRDCSFDCGSFLVIYLTGKNDFTHLVVTTPNGRTQLDCAYLIALVLGMMLVKASQRTRLDWHGDRGLSFLQLGLRELARLCYERLPLPILPGLPKGNPPPACASQAKRDALDCRIEFSRVISFSF